MNSVFDLGDETSWQALHTHYKRDAHKSNLEKEVNIVR